MAPGWSGRQWDIGRSEATGALAAVMMGGMASTSKSAPPSARRVLLRYALGTAVATIAIVAGGYFVLRSVAADEAKRNTRMKVVESGQLVESAITDGLVTGDAAARRTIDDLVVGRVLSGSIVRVKIWSRDGRVLYSDDPGQLGGRYVLGDDEQRILRDGGAVVEVSNLDRPENVRDRGQGKLIEAYTPIRKLGDAGAVRDLRAARFRQCQCAPAPLRAGASDPGRDCLARARSGSARVVADARAAARRPGPRGAACERDCRLQP